MFATFGLRHQELMSAESFRKSYLACNNIILTNLVHLKRGGDIKEVRKDSSTDLQKKWHRCLTHLEKRS